MPTSGQTLKKSLHNRDPDIHPVLCTQDWHYSTPHPNLKAVRHGFPRNMLGKVQGWFQPLTKKCPCKHLFFILRAMKRLVKYNISFCSAWASMPGTEGFFIDVPVKSC